MGRLSIALLNGVEDANRAIAAGTPADGVQSALEALPNVGVGNVRVVGTPGSFAVVFGAALGGSYMAALVAAGCAGVVRNSVATRFSKAVRAGIVEAVIVGNRGRAGVYRRAPAYAACVTFPQIGRDPRHRKGQA